MENKYIVSTTGQNINFNLSGKRKIEIETKIPVQVNEVEFEILKTRLGNQVKEVQLESLSEPTPVAETSSLEQASEVDTPVAETGDAESKV